MKTGYLKTQSQREKQNIKGLQKIIETTLKEQIFRLLEFNGDLRSKEIESLFKGNEQKISQT
jgi:hypothetical protein